MKSDKPPIYTPAVIAALLRIQAKQAAILETLQEMTDTRSERDKAIDDAVRTLTGRGGGDTIKIRRPK